MEFPSTKTAELVFDKAPQLLVVSEKTGMVPLAHALFLHSDWTYDHSLRVGFIAAELARNAKYDLDGQILGFHAGIAHDLGKIFVPVEVINHPEKLPPEFEELMNNHPRWGFNMINGVYPKVAEIMVSHHEWQERPYPRVFQRELWYHDGGFKYGLQMIMAMADGVDALRSKRPYKESWNEERTLRTLIQSFPEDEELIKVGLEAYGQVTL